MTSRGTARALAYLALHPDEALDRTLSKLDHFVDRRRRPSRATSYRATPDSEHALHEQLAIPFPCEARAEFDGMWGRLEASLAESNVFVGEWRHDADPGFARLVWCVVRHVRPRQVVETGVARGITSRVVLEGLAANGAGKLASVDLPVLRAHWHEQTAAAVPRELRSAWTYVRGSSRRRLPGLLAALGSVDVFIHDSAHTESNMRFEFELAWPMLRPGGVLVSHDIAMNPAFASFAQGVSAEPIVAEYEDSRGLVGVLVKPS